MIRQASLPAQPTAEHPHVANYLVIVRYHCHYQYFERWSFYGISDVSVAASLVMILFFLTLCLGIVAWIFKTGYRIKP